MKKFFVSMFLTLASMFVSAQCPSYQMKLDIFVSVDWFGSETSFYLYQNPEQVDYNGNLGAAIWSRPPGTYPNGLQGQTFSDTLCVSEGCYMFVVGDTNGDGMGFSQGSYELLLGDSVLASGGGNFGGITWDNFCVEIPNEIPQVFGCTDLTACNYVPGANQDDGSCLYPGSPCQHDNPLVTQETYTDNCECFGVVISGCMNPLAFNYNQDAVVEDGSCYFHPGCTLEQACNYDPVADFDDGSCDLISCIVVGCMDYYANNYDPLANTPDPNGCWYQFVSFEIIQNCKEVILINTTPQAPTPGPGVWFAWDFGNGSSPVSLSEDTLYLGYENGEFEITLVYAQGQSLQSITQTIVVNDFETQPILSMSDDALICDALADTYVWYVDDELLASTSQNTIPCDGPGVYTCHVSRGGCQSVSNQFLVTSVARDESKAVNIFPTVVSDSFTIEHYVGLVSLYDMSGRLVYSTFVSGISQVDCSLFSSGTYLVRGETFTMKIVK